MAAGSDSLIENRAAKWIGAARQYALTIFLFVLAIWLIVSGAQLVNRILHLYCVIPVWDYWRAAEHFNSYQQLKWSVLWMQHNEHRIIFPEIVFAADMLFLHGRQILPLSVSFLCYVLAFAILASSFCSEKRVRGSTKAIAVCVAGLVMFWQGAASPLADSFLLQWTLLQVCVVCALWCVVSLQRTRSDKYLLYVVIAAAVGTYSSGNGLLVWIILLAAGAVLKIDRKRLLILAGSAVVFDSLYFIGYRFSHDSHPENLFRHPLYFVQFAAAYLGMPFSEIGLNAEHRYPTVGIMCGLFQAISVAALATVAVRRDMLGSRSGIVLFGSYVFTVLTLLITAVGRMDPNDPTVQAAMQARYLTVPLMNWAVIILIYFWFEGQEKQACSSAVALGVLWAVLLAIGLPKIRPWLASESNTFAQYQLTELSLQDGLVDKRLLMKIFPSAEFIKQYLPELKQERLSIYYKWRGRWLGKDVASYGPVSTVRVPGEISFTYPEDSGVEIAGWGDMSRSNRSYRWVLLANERAQIVGFGEKLPAGFPNTIASSKTPPSLGWVGFVNLHYATETVSAYLIDERRSGLIPIGSPTILPNTQSASLQQMGVNLRGLTWSGDTNWAAGRLPLVIPGDKPNGAIYSSWYGSDRNTGELESSVFRRPNNNCLILPVLHGPRVPGLSVNLMDADSNQPIASAPMLDDDTVWNFWRIPIPTATRHLRLQAIDEGMGWGEWVAIANPTECK